MSRKGTLLDDYDFALLGAAAESPLTDAELDRQLQQGKSAPSSAQQLDAEALLSAGFARIAEGQRASDALDTSVKAAAHGVKVLAPILAAVTQWVDPESDPAGIERIMGGMLDRVRADAARVVQAYGVPAEDSPPWLNSQISGQIMSILVRAVERQNGVVLQGDKHDYLAPLINLAKQAGGIATSVYACPKDSNVQLINALMLATSEVMTEYHAFSYFHQDAALVAQQITDYLHATVIEGTLDSMTQRFKLSSDERAYLGNSLLRQAGSLLASSWESRAPHVLESVKNMPKDQRRELLVTGYPLDAVLDDFEQKYQALELSAQCAIRSLSPGREIQQQERRHAPGQ